MKYLVAFSYLDRNENGYDLRIRNTPVRIDKITMETVRGLEDNFNQTYGGRSSTIISFTELEE